MSRAVVVHGHFYQPPRENPWTEEVPRQPTAAPFHDWNERVSAESYRPNGAARIVDERGRVVAIVNNYASISFDFGPTLLSWLEVHDPTTYGRILTGDRRGGGAMAQAFGHLILPLANERDIRTQVRWGLADFQHRFGRAAEGMWLPETAVNDTVLAVLAEEGVGFTILAPSQAARTRPLGAGDEPAGENAWSDADPAAVAGQVFRWTHPEDPGLGVNLLFYDGPLSHALAFELSTLSSQAFVDRAMASRSDTVLVAADGETFGHHHRYGDRLLAYALAVDAPRRGLEVTIATAAASAQHAGECEVHESAWSCVHGVGRWREDCGCSTGGEAGWNQQWRAPLRAALDVVKEAADAAFEGRGKEVLADPWAARDAYVRVLIGAEDLDDFIAAHVTAMGEPAVSDALTLLEAQRHVMSMYTSCGWFFNDLAGIETVQVLCYAARVIDLLAEVGEDAPAAEFLAQLQKAHSNDPEAGDGLRIWREQVLPTRVGPDRVAAHVALVELLEHEAAAPTTASYDVDMVENLLLQRGPLTLVSGRVALTHRRTRRRTEHVYAALHLGGMEVIGVTRGGENDEDDALEPLREAFRSGSPITVLVRRMGELGGEEFNLSAALPGRAEEILESAAEALAERFAVAYDRLFDDHRATLEALAAAGYPLPPVLRAPAELSLARRLEHEVVAQAGSVDPASYTGALAIVDEARAAGVSVDTPSARAIAGRLLLQAVTRAVDDPEHAEDAAAIAAGAVGLARDLGLHPDVEPAQELVYEAMLAAPTTALRALARSLGLAVDALGHPR